MVVGGRGGYPDFGNLVRGDYKKEVGIHILIKAMLAVEVLIMFVYFFKIIVLQQLNNAVTEYLHSFILKADPHVCIKFYWHDDYSSFDMQDKITIGKNNDTHLILNLTYHFDLCFKFNLPSTSST